MRDRAALLAVFALALPAARAQEPAPSPAVTIYPGDLALVTEILAVDLPAGRSELRVDFVRGNADGATLEVIPLDHPEAVRVLAFRRRNDLGSAVFVEVEATAPGRERLQLRYQARGFGAAVSYVAVYDPAAGTLDLAQEHEIDNRSGQALAGAAVGSVFGDVKVVPSNAVLHGRTADPNAPQPIAAEPLVKDFSEHTVVAFGAAVQLPDGVLARRRVLDLRAVPVALELRWDAGAGQAVRRVAKAKNAVPGLGGVTLQPGAIYVAERGAGGVERYIRSGSLGHLPPGQDLELEVGTADDLSVEREVLKRSRGDLAFGEYNRQLLSYGEQESIRVRLKNFGAAERLVRVTEHVTGTDTFEIQDASVAPVRRDRGTLEFEVAVPAGATVDLTYRAVKSNVRVS